MSTAPLRSPARSFTPAPRLRAIRRFSPLRRLTGIAAFAPVDLADTIFAAPTAVPPAKAGDVPEVPFAERPAGHRMLSLRLP